MYKTLMIVNLESGKGKFQKQLSYIVNELKNKEFEIVIKYTSSDLDADKIIQNYNSNFDLLIVCGDDGTLNRVITALTKLNLNVSVAFIPTGITNDFGKTLNLPKKEIVIAQNIINSRALKVDTGKFNNDYFNYVVAFGAFTEVAYNTEKIKKRKFGRLAYIMQGVKQLKKITPYKMKIYFDNETIEDEFIYGSISNSISIGGLKWFKPDEISLGDGKLEVILIKKPKKFFEYFSILKSIITKDYSTDRNIIFSQDEFLSFQFQEPVNWTIDGENAGLHKNVKIGVINQNIEYLIM